MQEKCFRRQERGRARAGVITRGVRNPELGNVWVFVQLIFGPHWPLNQLNKNPNSRIPDTVPLVMTSLAVLCMRHTV